MSDSEARLYFDTSALLPYYREEALSEQVEGLLQTEGTIYISRLTEVEVFSALARWQRMAELTADEAAQIQTQFEAHLAQNFYRVHTLPDAIFDQAKHWLSLRQTALRTLDALHLACAQSVDAKLITADDKLSQAAQAFSVDFLYLKD